MDINEIMREYAQYKRMQEEIADAIESLKDQIKQYMKENGVDTITSAEHKAAWKPVAASRIDTAALKKENPGIYAAYTKTTENMRFTFN